MIWFMLVVTLLTLTGCSSTTTEDGPSTWASEFAVGFACGVGTGVLIGLDPDFRFTPIC